MVKRTKSRNIGKSEREDKAITLSKGNHERYYGTLIITVTFTTTEKYKVTNFKCKRSMVPSTIAKRASLRQDPNY